MTFVLSKGEALIPPEGEKLRLTVSQRMPLDPNAVSVALQRSGAFPHPHDRGQLLSKDVALAGEDSGGCIFVVYMWMQSAVLR